LLFLLEKSNKSMKKYKKQIGPFPDALSMHNAVSSPLLPKGTVLGLANVHPCYYPELATPGKALE